jgi:hypothetical protein
MNTAPNCPIPKPERRGFHPPQIGIDNLPAFWQF